MERVYTYKNAIIHIKIPDNSSIRIREATENFLTKVIFEKEGVDSKWQQRSVRRYL